ncbi:hypothetical protein Q9966_003180 [Columba livia]|nr:hypothetical protein Q9966_003180 [Columba livia]
MLAQPEASGGWIDTRGFAHPEFAAVTDTLLPANWRLSWHFMIIVRMPRNLGRVDHVTEFEYDLFIRPDTCNPRFRVWFNFTVENVKESQVGDAELDTRYFIRQALSAAVPYSTMIKLSSHEMNGNLSQGGKEIWYKDTIYI